MLSTPRLHLPVLRCEAPWYNEGIAGSRAPQHPTRDGCAILGRARGGSCVSPTLVPSPPRPAWPRARPLAPSTGRPCPAQAFASGQGWAALPRRVCSEGGAPSRAPPVEMPGEICWINAAPRPGPHADMGFGAGPCGTWAITARPGGAKATRCPPDHPAQQLESPRGQASVPANLQPCSGVAQSHLDGWQAAGMGTGGRCVPRASCPLSG